MYKLPERMKDELRKPTGPVFVNTESLLTFIKKTKFPVLVAVGDVCAKALMDSGVTPDLVIIDGRTKREAFNWKPEFPGNIVRVSNEPSTISDGLEHAIEQFFNDKSVKTMIRVDGEEDLAVLPVLKHCPLNSLVIYGLWFKGVAAVTADEDVKNNSARIMDEMMRNED